MNIYVNDQKLDASLNDEKSLRDVYEAVDQWSRNQNHYIMNMMVDNEEVAPSRLEDLNMEQVDRLDFTVADHDQFIVEAVHELDRYLDQVGSFLFQKEYLTADQFQDLSEGVEWIEQAVGSLAGLLNLDLENLVVPLPEGHVSAPIAHTMGALGVSLESLKSSVERGADQKEELETVLLHLRPIKSMSMRLALQLAAQSANPEELLEALERFDAKMPEFKDQIVATNEAFQSGREVQALEMLDSVVERLQGFMSCIFALEARCKNNGMEDVEHEGMKFSEAASTLMELLKDLSSALEENDITAAGDILEYELTEKLDMIQPFPGLLRNFVVASK